MSYHRNELATTLPNVGPLANEHAVHLIEIKKNYYVITSTAEPSNRYVYDG